MENIKRASMSGIAAMRGHGHDKDRDKRKGKSNAIWRPFSSMLYFCRRDPTSYSVPVNPSPSKLHNGSVTAQDALT